MRWITAVIGTGMIAAAVTAADVRPSKLLNSVTACRSITDNTARLSCYDAAVAPLAEATDKGDLKVIDREDVRRTRRSLFGFDIPKVPFFSGDDSANETPPQVETTLSSARGLGYGNFGLTMADGSVWNTTEALPRDPKAGAAVVLKRGALGNYFVHVGSMRPVRAVRVK